MADTLGMCPHCERPLEPTNDDTHLRCERCGREFGLPMGHRCDACSQRLARWRYRGLLWCTLDLVGTFGARADEAVKIHG